jgi:hypothetical protein
MNELETVHRAADKAARWTEQRNQAILEARAAGYPLRTIADAAGLSHTAIAKILARS